MGGAAEYTAHRWRIPAHAVQAPGLAISGAQAVEVRHVLSTAADDANLPADPEFRAAVMG